MTEATRSIFRSAIHFLSGTMLSRLTGMLRDIAMAFCFGTNPALAAFMVAYRFVYLIRRLFGEGLLHQGFIPHFEELRTQSPPKGAAFFRDLFSSLALFLIFLLLLIEGAIFLSWKVNWLSRDVALMSLLIVPGLFFICLYGLTSALLQCEKKFFLSSTAPVAFNLVWIGGVFALHSWPIDKAMIGLSLVLVIAFAAQWLITMPKTLHFLRSLLSLKECFKANLFSTEVRKLARPLALGILGVGATQFNSAVDAIFARFADPEGPAYLWYAIRIQQLPLALFGIALASALLPSLSRALERGEEEKFHQLLQFGFKRTFTLVFPCMIAILVLGACSVNMLFGRGDFTEAATRHTLQCLWCYGFGLLPATFVLILAQAFYARKDYRTPALGFTYSALFNIALNALLVFYFHLGAESIALATSAAAFLNAIFLFSKLRKREKRDWLDSSLLISFLKVGFAALVAGAIVLTIGHFFAGDPTLLILQGETHVTFARDFSKQFLQFGVEVGAFILLFLSYAFVLRTQDLLEILGVPSKN